MRVESFRYTGTRSLNTQGYAPVNCVLSVASATQ